MNKCKYTNTNFKCAESSLDGYELCALHTPFSGIAADDKKLNELKNSAISQKIRNNDYDFSGAILLDLDLSPSEFGGQIKGETIENDIYFENAEITNRFTLTGTTVKGKIHAANSKLGTLHCDNCNIKSDIEFEKSAMRYMTFYKARIEGCFQLYKCTLSDTIVLSDSQIDGEITIKDSTMKGISFSDGISKSSLSLENITASGDLSFWRCKVKSLYFEHLLLAGNIYLDGAEILNNANFNTVQLSEKFSCYGIIFSNQKKKKNIENEIEIFQKASSLCSRNGYRHDADRHFFYEMQSRRKLKNSLFQVPDLVIEILCKYGTDWKPICFSWIIAIPIFALTYYKLGGLKYSNFSGIGVDFWDNFYFSIVTITTLGYGDIHPTGITKIFASLEAVMGTFLWALFIIVISRKYMKQ